MTFSTFHWPPSRYQRKMALESAAPTKPVSASGSCSQRTSSGISPSSPRSIDWTTRLSARSQKWMLWPYLPAPTSSRLKPSLKVLGAAHSLETIAFWRGWYQKS